MPAYVLFLIVFFADGNVAANSGPAASQHECERAMAQAGQSLQGVEGIDGFATACLPVTPVQPAMQQKPAADRQV